MKFLSLLFCLCYSQAYTQSKLFVYAWGGEIPKKILQQFENETGIDVHFSTYDSNETMYAKLKANSQAIYDVIIPSAYFVERMRKQNMLTHIDHKQLSYYKNLNPIFLNHTYDPKNAYSIPYIWGATGIFYNQKHIKAPIKHWRELWDNRWYQQLMLLDDPREMFAIALLKLGFSANDQNPKHIQQAYQALIALQPNIKFFASDSVQANIIDEDATIGTIWNGDAHKTQQENPHIQFTLPNEGFVIWIDCLAIPKNAPHLKEAYQFINYLLRADVAKQVALHEGHALTNQAAVALLPPEIRNNPMIYPPNEKLKQATFQNDIGEKAMNLYNQYWQKFKLSI